MFRLIVLAVLTTATLASVRYDNFKVFEVVGRTAEERAAINELEKKSPLLLDFWRGAGLDLPAHISVSPADQEAFILRLTDIGLDYKVVVKNVQDQIDEVDRQTAAIPFSARNINNSYYTYEKNKEFLTGLSEQYSDRMSVVDFGKSRYGRDLFYVKLSGQRFSSSKPDDSTKPVIWMEAATHAREWITNACILNLIEWIIGFTSPAFHRCGMHPYQERLYDPSYMYEGMSQVEEFVSQLEQVGQNADRFGMLKNYEPDSDARNMLDKFDWFIVPIQNPDGYIHSHTSDRLWRKTRTTGSCSSWQGRGNGVDPNRNWAYGWGINGQTNICAADYQGPGAFSEPSTKGMAEQMEKTPAQYRKAFLSLHSFSQMILTPYGYDRYATVPNYSEQLRVANAAAQAIRDKSGTDFRVGKPGELLYNAPGGAFDYAYGQLGYTYSLTYELHPASSNPGFQLPPDKIAASFSDFLASIKAIVREMQ